MGLNLWRIGSLLEVVILVRGERGLVGSLHLLDLSLTVHLEKIEIRLELLCLLLTTRGLELFAAFLVKKVLNFGIIWIDLLLMIINGNLSVIRAVYRGCQLAEGVVFQVHLMAKIIVVF